jgi:glycosyltransferase involved in cell wall biosynthesis
MVSELARALPAAGRLQDPQADDLGGRRRMAPAGAAFAAVAPMTGVLFVNSGILGMSSFSKFIREATSDIPEFDASHINLSEHLSLDERGIRRLFCARLWRDGWFGLKNMDFERLRSEYHAGFQASRRIRKLMARKPIDVIHFHRQATAYGSMRLMARVPSIVSIDATQDILIDAAPSSIEKWSYGPNATIDGRVFRAAKAIISTSQWASDCLHQRYPCCRTPVYVMPSPVRLHCFDPNWIEQRVERAAAPGYLPRVLFVGGDFIRKGGTDLLHAWRDGRLAESATLDIVTNWPVPAADVPGINVIRGVAAYSREWLDIWRSADVFVLPTRQEAFANVFQEAAAAGLPRIGPRIGAVPETIHDGEDGVLVTQGDRAGLIAALRCLIASAALRDEFGRAGRRNAEQSGPDVYISGLRAIIQSVVRRPS